MGWPIYVYAYLSDMHPDAKNQYRYFEVYAGRNWIKAILAAAKAKRKGAGCVKIEWR